MGVRCIVADSGDLVFTAGNADRQEIADTIRSRGSLSALRDALEPLTCNSDIGFVQPEEIGALTDAPILAEHDRDDRGDLSYLGRVWYFPDYMLRDPAEELARKGRTVFTLHTKKE